MMSSFRTLLRLTRPVQLLFATLAYILGAGMARYLTGPLGIAAFALGLIWVLLILLAAYLLAEYFRLPYEPLEEGQTPRQRERLRILLFQVSIAALTLVAAFTILMIFNRLITLPADIFLVLIFLTLMAYAVPPLRLVNTGFGEIALAVLWADFIPALAFLLQSDGFHRLLPLLTFPLTLLALAYLLINTFSSFAADQKYGRRTLLIRLTWPRAIPLHHFLILTSYLIFAIAPFFGLAWEMVWPAFLTFPFAVIQIYWLHRISQGGRPLWRFLIPYAGAVFGLTVYFLAFTFWIR